MILMIAGATTSEHKIMFADPMENRHSESLALNLHPSTLFGPHEKLIVKADMQQQGADKTVKKKIKVIEFVHFLPVFFCCNSLLNVLLNDLQTLRIFDHFCGFFFSL